jgi:hypothetical protein
LNQLSTDDGADPVALLVEEQTSSQQSNEPDCHHSLANSRFTSKFRLERAGVSGDAE